MLSSLLYAMLKLSKATSPPKLITLYLLFLVSLRNDWTAAREFPFHGIQSEKIFRNKLFSEYLTKNLEKIQSLEQIRWFWLNSIFKRRRGRGAAWMGVKNRMKSAVFNALFFFIYIYLIKKI